MSALFHTGLLWDDPEAGLFFAAWGNADQSAAFPGSEYGIGVVGHLLDPFFLVFRADDAAVPENPV